MSHRTRSAAGLLVLPLACWAAWATASPAAADPAPACRPGTAQPADAFPGTIVLADNFESGTLTGWDVRAGGDGLADVESAPAPVYDGGCAARFRTTATAGSLANASVPLPPGTGQVYADGWFDITDDGGSSNPYFRFFAGATRVAQVYRVTGNGQLWVEVLTGAGSYTHLKMTSRAVSLSAWHRIQVALLPGGAATTVQVWLDGALLFSSSGIDGFTAPITTVMLGNERSAQPGDVSADDVIVKAAPASTGPGCTPPSTPTDDMPGQVIVADGFECGDLADWAVHMTGDGTASVARSPVHDGSYAACLHVSDVSPSMANLTQTLPVGTTAVSADAWFDVTAPGPAGNDVPYFRFFTGTTRFADIYRYNSTGVLWLRVLTPAGTYAYTRLTTQPVGLNTWHRLQTRLIAAGTASTIRVWLDGAPVYSSSAVATAATSISTFMLGAEHYPQPGAECIDDVILRSGS